MSIQTRRLRNGRTAYDVKLRDPAGRQYSRTFRTRREADAYVIEQRSSRTHGAWVDPRAGRISLADYSERWLRQRVNLRPRTRELYSYLLRLHVLAQLGEIELANLNPGKVREWHAALMIKDSIGPSTVAKCYRLLRTIMATAVEDELIVKNPCVLKGASVERPDERPVASVAEVAALVEAIDPRYRAMVLLATWCGLRFGELAALTRQDIDLAAGTVRVRRQVQELADGRHEVGPPKTDAGKRIVAIPPHALLEIRRHMAQRVAADGTSLIFPAPDGEFLRRSNFNRRIWQPACEAVGLRGFRFHDTRHTGNTLAASTGASTKELMTRMGHATPRAALIYQHGSPQRDQAIAKALSKLAEGRPASRGKNPRLQPDESLAAGSEG